MEMNTVHPPAANQTSWNIYIQMHRSSGVVITSVDDRFLVWNVINLGVQVHANGTRTVQTMWVTFARTRTNPRIVKEIA
jgi:hypothetical protein